MNNVHFLRDQKAMTQEEFSEYCNIPRISVARYEAGEPIGRKNAEKIAAACRVSVDFVIGSEWAENYNTAQVKQVAASLIADMTPEELAQLQIYAEFLKSQRKAH